MSEAPVSPCCGVCRLDAEGRLCLGCLRSLEEIAAWSSGDAVTRSEILANVAARRLILLARESKPTDGHARQD
ncbi:DUF1289 domain-containing protein [Niveibacterium sp. SC-1]|uniref:DUF1289 domain-containing protein n=1 Tax=Niveibacterium sp. SC-1 TaxID=3135646 RepID=UPI00311F60F9